MLLFKIDNKLRSILLRSCIEGSHSVDVINIGVLFRSCKRDFSPVETFSKMLFNIGKRDGLNNV